jgi:hypothetical protein
MAETVFAFCALASMVCAVLLWRSYRRERGALLFWSSMCFGWLAVNNLVLFIDRVVAPDVDLSIWRGLTALIGLGAFVYGLVWEDTQPTGESDR